MEFLSFVFNLFLCVLSCVEAQQPYIGQGTNRCSSTSDSALGYSCNGVNRTCPSYLTFRAQPPYTTVASISTLLGSNSSQLAAINSVPETASFPTNQLVLVPVTCSCSGPYYQTNTSFVVRTGDNFFFIANQTLQGLSTCQAIRNGNRRSTINIFPGQTLNIPLRCACPTTLGLDYLHSFTCPPQVHKDIKGGNVLLDSDFRAKIANLAQARSTEGQDGEFNLTRHIFGTKGYMAPEYLENGMVSTKIDVFAFGVLLLEMITGKEVASLYREGSNGLSNVLEEVVSHAEDGKENNLRQFLDTSMEGNYPIDLAVLILRLVHGCLNKNPANRPAMNELVQSLSRILTASLSWELSNNLSDYRNP
ncbi:LysM domain receptor-like kinase 4 [Linum perenne]